VRYRIATDALISYACHCRECQKQSASAFGISVPVMRANFEIEGAVKSWQRPTDSGSVTDCHFCQQCGSRIYHAGANRPGMVTVKGGSLDRADTLAPIAHIWTSSRQTWFALPEGLPQWETQPVGETEWMAMLGLNV
jgi:hypothetical protein